MLKGDSKDHRRVAQHFQTANDREHRKVGVWLKRLREDRRQADYEGDLPGLPAITKKAMDDARELINIIKLL